MRNWITIRPIISDGTVLYKGQSDITIKKGENALIITLSSTALQILPILTVITSGEGMVPAATSIPAGYMIL